MIDLGLTAADIMTRDVVTTTPGTPIVEAARLLASKHISGLPVVEESNRLVGVVTEGDLIVWRGDSDEREAWWLNLLAEGADLAPEYLEFLRSQHETVRSVMKTDIVTIGEDTPVRDIAALMVSRGVNRLPVVTDGRLVGIVARADLVRILWSRLRAPEAPAGPKIVGRDSDRPLLASEGIEKRDVPDQNRDLPDQKPTGRRRGRPLFP